MTHHLMGVHEIAARLGVSRQRVHQLAAQSSFPEPVAELVAGKVWDAERVEAWIREHRDGRTEGHLPT